MVRLQAPPGHSGVQFGARWFPADAHGVVMIPEEHQALAESLGFKPAQDAPAKSDSAEPTHTDI